MPLIGTTLNNRFYILKSLAQGGFGHTYLAEDRGFQARHHCVVKHLDPAKENLPYLDKIKVLFDRDIKPDNIMRRSPTELVLIDFGIAKDMGAASITKHSYGGTPGYAPEEQQHGKPELASDVYAVGKIAIQAITGLSPKIHESIER